MSLITSTATAAEDAGAFILFLDLEGVMTRGMLGTPVFSMVQLFHSMSGNQALAGHYSKEATRYVERLVAHGFRIVLITRHGKNESDILQQRLDHAGIKGEWFYHDPDAIGVHAKDDGIRDWFRRNPGVSMDRVIVLEDEPAKITAVPAGRVIGTDPEKGFTRADYLRVMQVIGVDVRSDVSASSHQGRPAPRA